MSLSNITERNYQEATNEYSERISHQQLLALQVAANYKLRRGSMGWWADGSSIWPVGVVTIHAPTTIKSLLKKGLLEGNARGENLALGGRDGKSTREPPIPLLWISEKGKYLLNEINERYGLVFDKYNYQVVEVEPQKTEDILDYDDDTDTIFLRNEIEDMDFSDELWGE